MVEWKMEWNGMINVHNDIQLA